MIQSTQPSIERTSQLLTVTDVATRLSVSVSMTYRLIASGKISSFRIGGRIRISEEQLARFLKEHETEQQTTLRSLPQSSVRHF